MEHIEKVKTLQFIRPNAQFVLRENELDWLDETQSKPSDAEIEAGWIAYQAKLEADKIEAEAKKQALLDRLGITAEEARLLLS